MVKNRFLKGFFKFSLIGLITLVGFEITLRVFESNNRISRARALEIYQDNPSGRGSFRLRPNLNILINVEGVAARIISNSFGMPWNEVPKEKKSGKKRLAILGDSFAQGSYAPDIKSTIAGVMDSVLSTHGWELYNFAVGGYGFADMELYLQETVLGFQPDAVMLLEFNGNDFRDTEKGLLDKSDITPPAGFKFFLYDHLALFRFYSNVRTARLLAEKASQSPFIEHVDPADSKGYGVWTRLDYPEGMHKQVVRIQEYLRRIDSICRANQIPFYLAAIPFREQVYSIAENGENFDIRRPQIFLEEVCTSDSIPYLDLLPGFRIEAKKQNKKFFFHWDVHLRPEGQKVAGELLAKWFLGRLEIGK